MYVALDTRQNATNVSPVAISTSGSSSTPPAAGAASTSTFLTHWRGRAAFTRPAAMAPGRRSGDVVVVTSHTSVAYG